MNASWALGFIAGLLVVAVLSLVARLILKRRGGRPGKYDERQQVERGRAFTVAYAVIMIYLALWFLGKSMGLGYCDSASSVLLGLLLSVGVFAGYSIFHDAYFHTSDRPVMWIAITGAVSLLNLGIGISKLTREGMLETRLFENLNLMTGIMTTAILICVLIKHAMDRRGEEK